MNLENLVVITWFVLNWVGYSYFAKHMAKKTHCLASVLQSHRIDWMTRMIRREQWVADAALLANIERNVTFFASTTILILAGILTLLTNVTQVFQTISTIPFQSTKSELDFVVKLLCFMGVFVYAFFTFTWSMRQYNMASVLVGAAPLKGDTQFSQAYLNNFTRNTGKVIDQAGHSYNYGLRSYYFSMAALTWFVNPWLCMAATSLIVGILYQREFNSKTLRTLVACRDFKES